MAARQALRAIIVEAFAAFTAEQVIERLDEAQIANARMNDMHDVWQHPQLKARGRWAEVGTPAGPVPALLPPGDTDAFEPRMDAVPALGQHTESILAELGWDVERIAGLRADRRGLKPRTLWRHSMPSTFLRRRAALALVATALAPSLASAQAYPSKPITLVVPFAAGGPTDVVARTLGAAMTRTLGPDGRHREQDRRRRHPRRRLHCARRRPTATPS